MEGTNQGTHHRWDSFLSLGDRVAVYSALLLMRGRESILRQEIVSIWNEGAGGIGGGGYKIKTRRPRYLEVLFLRDGGLKSMICMWPE